MRVILSLLLLLVGGVAFTTLPEAFFAIPKNEVQGVLRMWGGSLKLFAVPLCLLLLSFSKNVFIKLATVLWGSWMLLVTVLFFFRMEEEAPSVNLYGKLFISGILIVSLAVFLFSAIQFAPKALKFSSSENTPVNPS